MVNNVIPTIATIFKIRKTLGAKEDATIENTVKENNNLHTIMLNELKDKFYYLQYKYDYFKCVDKESEYDIIGNIYTNLLIYE